MSLYQKPEDFLNASIETIAQRGVENGYDAGQERSAAKIAEVFNALTGHKLTEADAWTFLIVLKLVRNQRRYKADNIVDMVGYAALLGECQATGKSALELGEKIHEAVFEWLRNPPKGKSLASVAAEEFKKLFDAFDKPAEPAHTGGEPPVVDVETLASALKNAPKAPAPEKQGRKPLEGVIDRPHVSFALACGRQLDAYAAMVGCGPRICNDMMSETDDAFRHRIASYAEKADQCLHPKYAIDETDDNSPNCLKCGAPIRIVVVREDAHGCPECGSGAFEEMGGGVRRCADCDKNYDKDRVI